MTEIERLTKVWTDAVEDQNNWRVVIPGKVMEFDPATGVRAILMSLRDDYTIGSAASPIRGLNRASELWRGMFDHLLAEN